MLSKITWHQWWLFVAAATVIYYLLVTILFFRKDLTNLLSGRRHPAAIFPGPLPANEDRENEETEIEEPDRPEEKQAQYEEQEQPLSTNDPIIESAAEVDDFAIEEPEMEANLAFMETISGAIGQSLSPYKGYANKEEVIQKLAHLMAGYKEAPAYERYEEAIDWHMNEQVKAHCGTTLSDSDLNRIRDIAGSLS